MKVALVTGGGSGIGRSAALELNKIDFTVYVVGRREEELIKTSSLATNNNHKIIPIKTDITIGSQVIALFDKIKSDHGRIDLLFNNAGMGAPRVPIEDLKEEDWRKTVDVNLTGSFLCSQQAIKLMKTQDKKSIFIELDDEGWKFTCDNYDINIDNGFYFGNKNLYTENQNIYITGISNNQIEEIKWKIEKI